MAFRRVFLLLLVLGAALSALACNDNGGGSDGGSVTLNGAGATFPHPLYSKWISEYGKANSGVRINYQSIGSGGGIRQILAGTVDFGATDAPLNDAERGRAEAPVYHIPTTLGAVAVAYNLPGVEELQLAPDVLADIFLGKIAKWNDPRIAATNPGVSLPELSVTVVVRSDGSGTTAVFSDYLAKVSRQWKDEVGQGKSLKWPAKPLAAKGNAGVAGNLQGVKGSIGYVELAYAMKTKAIRVAALKNRNGEFVKPSVRAVTAAAAGAEMPDTLHVSITDATGKGAYPISAYTYILVRSDTTDADKGKAVAKFLWWTLHDGQKHCADLFYAPLPKSVVTQVEKRLKQLKVGGQPALD